MDNHLPINADSDLRRLFLVHNVWIHSSVIKIYSFGIGNCNFIRHLTEVLLSCPPVAMQSFIVWTSHDSSYVKEKVEDDGLIARQAHATAGLRPTQSWPGKRRVSILNECLSRTDNSIARNANWKMHIASSISVWAQYLQARSHFAGHSRGHWSEQGSACQQQPSRTSCYILLTNATIRETSRSTVDGLR